MRERTRGTKRSGALALTLAKALFWCVTLAVPLIGMWVSSSLAIYHQRSLRVAIGIGLLAFPALPLVWESIAEWRRRHSSSIQSPHILTLGDRLLFRTLVINTLFLVALLASRPSEAFAAVSTRGDWMLEDSRGPHAERARRAIFGVARGLEWLYATAHDNPFRKWQKEGLPESRPDEKPQPTPVRPEVVTGERPTGTTPPARASWPWPKTLHPLTASIPTTAEGSANDVARYVAEREPDLALRAKAIHDWIADHIAYDAEAYAIHVYPPQEPDVVFRDRKAVCAGYALLFDAMATIAGLESAYIVGDARTAGWDEKGEGHAWNAVRFDGRWHLLDVTWDAGSVDGRTFKKGYRTDYFLTPPEAFIVDHFPDEARWQVREHAIDRGEFLRAPLRQPAFFAYGFELVTPDRAQVTVKDSIDIVVRNPRSVHLLANHRQRDAVDREGTSCVVKNGLETHVQCGFPRHGRYEVNLFASADPTAPHWSVAELAVNAE